MYGLKRAGFGAEIRIQSNTELETDLYCMEMLEVTTIGSHAGTAVKALSSIKTSPQFTWHALRRLAASELSWIH